jgi:hypothetical protein
METETRSVTYHLLMTIALASDCAKQNGCIIYVCQESDGIHITDKYPSDRKKILAKCWPGGRKEMKFGPQSVKDKP